MGFCRSVENCLNCAYHEVQKTEEKTFYINCTKGIDNYRLFCKEHSFFSNVEVKVKDNKLDM